MKNILLIGGTRNMGYKLALRLLEQGHQVTLLNRGVTKDTLPDAVHRLRADRTDAQQMKRALLGKFFDVVVDFVLYRAAEAETIVQLLRDKVGQYIFISTGQVYLVRQGPQRPYTEDEYDGRTQPEPKPNTFAHEEWRYGMDKRGAEDTLHAAYDAHQFPYTSLRLPMVNSEYDSFDRLYNYILRLQDGGTVLVPETPSYPLRHVYSGDVVTAIDTLINTGAGKGRAYNISQDETVTIDHFLSILGEIIAVKPRIVRVKRSLLEANGFLPDCSPFSERWMSQLDNQRSKDELGLRYTPLPQYLAKLVAYYQTHKPKKPITYKRRNAELQFAAERAAQEQAK
jgi:nucleoside-diphosphate-sugar epimerase